MLYLRCLFNSYSGCRRVDTFAVTIVRAAPNDRQISAESIHIDVDRVNRPKISGVHGFCWYWNIILLLFLRPIWRLLKQFGVITADEGKAGGQCVEACWALGREAALNPRRRPRLAAPSRCFFCAVPPGGASPRPVFTHATMLTEFKCRRHLSLR